MRFRASGRASMLGLLTTVLLAPGCAGMRHADRGALVGTTVGALAGGIIGHQSGNAGAGAVLGAGAGMITGAIVGDAEDAREERDAAMAHVRQVEYERRIAAEPPLTNNDLVFMCQNGLSDEVIVNAVKTRGGQFDLDPSALVTLKHNGVRDSLIARIQTMGGSTIRPVGRTTAIVAPTPPVVVVEPVFVRPPPRASFHFGTGHGHGHWHHCHHW